VSAANTDDAYALKPLSGTDNAGVPIDHHQQQLALRLAQFSDRHPRCRETLAGHAAHPSKPPCRRLRIAT